MIKAKGEWVPRSPHAEGWAGSASPWQPRDLPSRPPIVLGPPGATPGSCLKLPFLGLGAGSGGVLKWLGC